MQFTKKKNMFRMSDLTPTEGHLTKSFIFMQSCNHHNKTSTEFYISTRSMKISLTQWHNYVRKCSIPLSFHPQFRKSSSLTFIRQIQIYPWNLCIQHLFFHLFKLTWNICASCTRARVCPPIHLTRFFPSPSRSRCAQREYSFAKLYPTPVLQSQRVIPLSLFG